MIETAAGPATPADDGLQYARAKLHYDQAHALARGDGVRVGVIDTAVDLSHPELRGTPVETYDALGGALAPGAHGTAVAGLIAAHARLVGAAPQARLLSARSFDYTGGVGRGSSFTILKGIEWVAAHGARVINMSFAGPPDPDLQKSLAGAYGRGIVLIAAAGNAGPTSPPLYPAADPHVIAVTATDSDDKLYGASNVGPYINVAAPGVALLVAWSGAGYQTESGTSFAAAEVSGIAALMLQRDPHLTPDQVRARLYATGHGVATPRQAHMDARLVDAYAAISR